MTLNKRIEKLEEHEMSYYTVEVIYYSRSGIEWTDLLKLNKETINSFGEEKIVNESFSLRDGYLLTIRRPHRLMV